MYTGRKVTRIVPKVRRVPRQRRKKLDVCATTHIFTMNFTHDSVLIFIKMIETLTLKHTRKDKCILSYM